MKVLPGGCQKCFVKVYVENKCSGNRSEVAAVLLTATRGDKTHLPHGGQKGKNKEQNISSHKHTFMLLKGTTSTKLWFVCVQLHFWPSQWAETENNKMFPKKIKIVFIPHILSSYLKHSRQSRWLFYPNWWVFICVIIVPLMEHLYKLDKMNKWPPRNKHGVEWRKKRLQMVRRHLL